MKAILEFNLPEDEAEHSVALQGSAWKSVVLDIDLELRNWVKYGNEFKMPAEALEAVRGLLREGLNSRGLLLD